MAPMQSKLRQVLGVVKDQTSISLAKVTGTVHAELDVVLVKATSHDEIPVDEKYVQEIILMISNSPNAMASFVSSLSRRLHKTHDWIVALKCLVFVHQLLRAGDDKFEEEMVTVSRQRLPFLNLSTFKDEAHSNSWDFSAFVRTYASFLIERLDFYADVGSVSDNIQRKAIPGKEMKTEVYLDRLPKLQTLLDRAIACRPTGGARNNRLVQIALCPVVRESFQLYFETCNGITVLLDGFFETEHWESLKALDIYSKAAKQADELASFYDVCQRIGVCAPHEYPEVQRIPKEHLETMEEFVREQANVSCRPSGTRLALPAPDTKFDEPEGLGFYDNPIPDGSHLSDRRGNSPAATAPPKQQTSMTMQPKTISLPLQDTVRPPSPKKMTTSSSTTLSQHNTDLLNLGKASISAEEHNEKMALALFPPSSGTTITNTWETFIQATEDESNSDAFAAAKPGWELALVASSPLSKSTSSTGTSMAGNFDKLLLESLYEQGQARQKLPSATIVGSASSVAFQPGKPASSFLALPASPLVTLDEDPFAASVAVPPPAYVQMADMTRKQNFLLQEQQLWQHYQKNGMQGYCTFGNPNQNIYNGLMATSGVQSLPYQYVGGITSYGHNYTAYL